MSRNSELTPESLAQLLSTISMELNFMETPTTINFNRPPTRASRHNQVRPCPGLVRTDKGDWYVPEGSKMTEQSICGACMRELDVQASLYRGKKVSCNCDAYLYKSALGNPVFNISLWSMDKKTTYPTKEKDSVEIPSGEFRILVTALNLDSKSAYKCRIKNDKGQILEKTQYIYRHTYLTKKPFTFINNATELEFAQSTLVFGPATTLNVEIDIYKRQKTDNTELSNVNLERVQLNSNGDPYYLNQDQIVNDYDTESRPACIKAIYTYAKFTKKPLVMKFMIQPVKDENPSLIASVIQVVQKRKKRFLEKQLANTQLEIKQMIDKSERLDVLIRQRNQIEQKIEDLKDIMSSTEGLTNTESAIIDPDPEVAPGDESELCITSDEETMEEVD